LLLRPQAPALCPLQAGAASARAVVAEAEAMAVAAGVAGATEVARLAEAVVARAEATAEVDSAAAMEAADSATRVLAEPAAAMAVVGTVATRVAMVAGMPAALGITVIAAATGEALALDVQVRAPTPVTPLVEPTSLEASTARAAVMASSVPNPLV